MFTAWGFIWDMYPDNKVEQGGDLCLGIFVTFREGLIQKLRMVITEIAFCMDHGAAEPLKTGDGLSMG